jgi:hypothetical protein
LEDERPVRVAQARAFVQRDVCALMIPHRSRAVNNGNLCALTGDGSRRGEKKVKVKVKGHKKTETRKVKQTKPASLQMPTAFVGQNGAEIHQSTRISVTGCPPARAKARPAKKKAKRKRAKTGSKK